MKKLLTLLLAATLLLSLCACGTSGEKNNPDGGIMSNEDYLVTIELTPENFNDYFECVMIPALDENGDPTFRDTEGGPQYSYVMGLKSTKYDDGYIIYDAMYDADEGGGWFEYELQATENGELIKEGSSDLWRALKFVTGEYDIVFETPHYITSPSQYTMKLVDCGGTVTFLNSKCVNNIEITEDSNTLWGYKQYSYSYSIKDDYIMELQFMGFNNLVFSDFAY